MQLDESLMLLAQAEGGQQPGGWEGLGPIILMAVILFVFMFFMRRSQKRQVEEQEKLVDSLKQGQKVMLNSGLFGRIDKVNKEDREVVLIVDENKRVALTYNLLAVAKVVDEQTKSVEPSAEKK
ncbi:preprotein translocase subunit YajC [bacterium]|nr:MAG: preprotein translocase subunit YajC [bacterium]RIK65330.1 MAG: preprotein translocase subunit YajC [Planctomycetota bacterium]